MTGAGGVGDVALVVAVGASLGAALTGRRTALRLGAVAAVVACAALAWALVTLDVSLVYVAGYASRSTSWPYRLAGLWGGMAGSLLLWAAMLAVVAAVGSGAAGVGALGRRTMGATAGVVLLASRWLAPPFARLDVPALDGDGLVPILHHSSMLHHPPLLYLGQVLLLVPFAVAVGAPRLAEAPALRSVRTWLTAAWAVLTVAIVAGAHWAYVELGWGGYWAWDPVENAALLPWLAVGASIHLLRRVEHGGDVGSGVTVAVAAPFVLATLGGWLSRSGATGSVHAFAEAAAVGRALLAVTVVLCVGTAVAAWRRRLTDPGVRPGRGGRRAGLLLGVALFALAAVVVAWGTLFPAVSELGGRPPVSVAGRFFAVFATPVALLAIVSAGVVPLLRWRGGRRPDMHSLRAAAVGAVVVAVVVVAVTGEPATAVGGLASGSLVALTFVALRRGSRPWTSGRIGGLAAHLGAAILAFGITGTTAGSHARAVVDVGDGVRVGDTTLVLRDVTPATGPAGGDGAAATFDLVRDGRTVGRLRPSLVVADRRGGDPLAELALRSTPATDVLVAVRRADLPAGRVTVEAWETPLVVWVWVGGLLVAVGAGAAAVPRRRRRTPGDGVRVDDRANRAPFATAALSPDAATPGAEAPA